MSQELEEYWVQTENEDEFAQVVVVLEQEGYFPKLKRSGDYTVFGPFAVSPIRYICYDKIGKTYKQRTKAVGELEAIGKGCMTCKEFMSQHSNNQLKEQEMEKQFDDFWVLVGNEQEFDDVCRTLRQIGYKASNILCAGGPRGYCHCQGYIHAWGAWDDGYYTIDGEFYKGTLYTYQEFMEKYGNKQKENQMENAQQQKQLSPLPEGVSIAYKDKQGNVHATIEEAVEANKQLDAKQMFVKTLADSAERLVGLEGLLEAGYDAEMIYELHDWLVTNKSIVLKLYGMREQQ